MPGPGGKGGMGIPRPPGGGIMPCGRPPGRGIPGIGGIPGMPNGGGGTPEGNIRTGFMEEEVERKGNKPPGNGKGGIG